MNLSSKPAAYPKAVLFDLLTALLDSWTLWNVASGGEEHGRRWRTEYLRLTYGCGAYVPYEQLVRQAARNTGLPESAAQELKAQWSTLPVWSGAREALLMLQPHCKLAVVTNCSCRLGHEAAFRLGIAWDAVVTAEEAGFYKPHPQPYQLTLQRLGISAREAAFVAGSGYDMFGTSRVGLRTYWHNRVGLKLPTGAPTPEVQSATLDSLGGWLQGFQLSLTESS